MASIAIVHSYPYDAFFGGDGAYIQAFGRYLLKSGHEVHGYVSNIARGRRSPVCRSVYEIEQFSSWQVRRSIRLGQRTFLSTELLRSGHLAGSFLGRKTAPVSPMTDQNFSKGETQWVLDRIEAGRPDAVILFHDAVHFAPCLSRNGHRVFSLVGHLQHRNGAARWEAGATPGPDKNWTEEKRLSNSLKAAECVGFNSKDDASYARNHLGVTRVISLGMGFDNHEKQPDSNEPIVLFVGNATEPNRAALSWFLKEVWPTVRTSCPTARVRIVGTAAFTCEVTPAAGLECVGALPDLAPEYRRAQLVVAPLVSGSAGVKIKVAEAMSYGRPLVTTSIGVDAGDPHQLDEGAIVANGGADFAQAVIALLSNAELRRQKSEGTAHVFASLFSCDVCYGPFLSWLRKAGQVADSSLSSQMV
ncbi:glycosyltransferase [Mesorhizobium ciceri]|uniref:glycosyltransferase n=2 Tax=Mesorhizobium ciceri TaxID=39645 RepID=UPI000A7E3F62